ncbi:MAG: diguanylate cyclase, partial [Nitrospirota bacterium]|nr:diguanylate cyclase [Nitrospirota bacterium]
MQYDDLIASIQQLGKDPARLIFEDELTAIPNRRFLLNYFEHQVRWDLLDVAPISLLMMDVDYFKRINDTHGHDAGDQALVYVARLLKDVSGEQSIPIRYAGDEFIVLTSGLKDEALVLAETLVERIHAEPLRLAGGVELPLTLSIGIATAPDNAKTGKELTQKADTALYQAKRAGRDRIVHVSDTQPEAVSDKVVLRQLVGGAICARQEELNQVKTAIQQFDQGEGRFIVVEGAAGMGKTMFLETVRRLLQGREEGPGIDAYVVRSIGLLQEDYRPYYLMTSILVALLGYRED